MSKNALCLAGVLTAVALCLRPPAAQAQPLHPQSFDMSYGVHLVNCDSLPHRSSAHYEALCRIVLSEFKLPVDSICLTVVFVNNELMAQLKLLNNDRFDSDTWQGMCINRFLVMVDGAREADDTFMHEYMHALQQQGLLFKDLTPVAAHELIRLNEGLLLGSPSYLKYLQSLPAPKLVVDE